MKGKDLSKPSVIRRFCRILNTALFALVLSFSVNFAFGGGTCNAPIYAGTYCYTASTTNANAPVSINTCPSGCFCPLRISSSVTAISTTSCNSINPGYSYTGSEIGGNAYRCPKSFTFSASGSDSANDCYADISAGYYYDITADSGGISNVTNAQCQAGYYCPGMTLSYGNAVNGIYGRTECPANTYNPNTRETSNSACLACATNATSSAGSAYCTCKTGYSIGGGTTGAAYSTSAPSGSTCTEISAIIALISDVQTSSGTTTIYTTYNTGVYLDSARTIPMTLATNTITKPTKSGYIFAGYYSSQNGGTQYINSDGYITTDGLNAAKALTSVGPHNWYPHWFAEPTCTSNQFLYDGTCHTLDFSFTTKEAKEIANFNLAAKGTFFVDWDDDDDPNIEVITRSDTSSGIVQHAYGDTKRKRTIRIGSYNVTAYNPDPTVSTIDFSNCYNSLAAYEGCLYMDSLSGSLGAVFPTLTSGTQRQPRFLRTFYSMIYSADGSVVTIPSTLFNGITGAPIESMFEKTFAAKGWVSARIKIPSDLFSGISGAPAKNMFKETFSMNNGSGDNCINATLTPNFFGNIVGAPAEGMFQGTFFGAASYLDNESFAFCDLTSIPENLFSGISGAPAENMFSGTFMGQYKITSIPAGLFRGISGAPAKNMFNGTFSGTGITSIPYNLFCYDKSNNKCISGPSAEGMFQATFNDCAELTSIPSELFQEITGPVATKAFDGTFWIANKISQFTFKDGSAPVSYIPESFYENMDDTGYTSGGGMYYMFKETNLLETCPENTYKINTNFEVDWNNKVSCSPCPSGTHYNGTGATSVNQCCADGYDWNGEACQPNDTCEADYGEGWHYSDEAGQCVDENGCTADEVYDEDTGICHEPCGENEYWNGTNCVLNTFNVVYANGGGSGSDPTTPTSCTYNGTCNAPSNPYVRSDYIFEGWECTSSSGSCTKSTYLPNESISRATNVNGATITLTAKWHTFSESDCPLYENTDEADTEHYKYNSYGTRQVGIYRYYILGSRYKRADNEISRCQVFFNVDNSLIPHTATDISGYTHTMVRVAYSVADINKNGYTANKNNYNNSAQIQFNGVNSDIRLHCASGYANKQAESGMIFYPTLAEALANACTKVEENHYVDDGVTELSCPNEYPHSLGNGGKTSCYANLTFVYNNGTNDETREIYYTASSSNGYKITNLPEPNRNGFSFGGWYTSANFTGDAINANTVFSNGDQTLYAKWVCEPGYTLNATTGACEPCAPGTYKSTGGDESCAACAVGSYTNTTGATSCIACQNGTTTSGPGLTSCNAICENNAHVSVWENATWTDNSVSNLCAINTCDNYYYITNEMCAHINIQLSYIDSLDNSVIETTPQMCTYNEAFNLPDTPTRIGYKFTGWELVK